MSKIDMRFISNFVRSGPDGTRRSVLSAAALFAAIGLTDAKAVDFEDYTFDRFARSEIVREVPADRYRAPLPTPERYQLRRLPRVSVGDIVAPDIGWRNGPGRPDRGGFSGYRGGVVGPGYKRRARFHGPGQHRVGRSYLSDTVIAIPTPRWRR
jgi:hypothetical protein